MTKCVRKAGSNINDWRTSPRSLLPLPRGSDHALFRRVFDRDDLERRRVGLDAERLVRDQRDLAQRRLLEVAGCALADRILPDADRSLADQEFGDAAGVLAVELG